MLGIVAVGVVRESRKFSGHPCTGRIARSSLRQHSFLVLVSCRSVPVDDVAESLGADEGRADAVKHEQSLYTATSDHHLGFFQTYRTTQLHGPDELALEWVAVCVVWLRVVTLSQSHNSQTTCSTASFYARTHTVCSGITCWNSIGAFRLHASCMSDQTPWCTQWWAKVN